MTAKAGRRVQVLRPYLYPILLIVLFYLVIGIGMLTGNWHSRIPYEQYQRLIPQADRLEH
jgi:hypothetical protein